MNGTTDHDDTEPAGEPLGSRSRPRHVLLSSMGVTGPRETPYERAGRVRCGNFSALALAQLLPETDRPDVVAFLLTPKAKRAAWDAICAEAATIGIAVEAIELPGDAEDDTRQFLEIAADRIPGHCRLSLDVTQGLRHHAFLFYALALYLSKFREVEIRGVWYCRLEVDGPDRAKPVIDLKPVLDLADWFHALATFRNEGLTREMARLIRPVESDLRARAKESGNDPAAHEQASRVKKLVDALDAYSFAYASGLTLELGKASTYLAAAAHAIPETEMGRRLPLSDALSDRVRETAESTAFRSPPTWSGEWKRKVSLDSDELRRQATMIDQYLRRDQVSLAVGLMREWVISWCMTDAPDAGRWLHYGDRKPFEQRLGALAQAGKLSSERPELSDHQRQLGRFWARVSDLRNTLMHYGMRESSVERKQTKLDGVANDWRTLEKGQSPPPPLGGGYGTLLICPLGLSPGVLYSALRAVRPRRLLVLASPESAAMIDDAITRSGMHVEHHVLQIDDPHAGFESLKVIREDAKTWLLEADEIHTNLTGGTALMGAIVGELASHASRQFQRRTRRLVLVDPRSPDQQQADPWHEATAHYLDGENEEGP